MNSGKNNGGKSPAAAPASSPMYPPVALKHVPTMVTSRYDPSLRRPTSDGSKNISEAESINVPPVTVSCVDETEVEHDTLASLGTLHDTQTYTEVEQGEEETEVDEELEEENQETVPTATTEAETEKEQGEAVSKGEQVEEEENVELENEQSNSEDEDLNVPLKNIKKPSVLTPRKSRRLASKSSSCLNDDITSQTPPSPKPDSPTPFHISSPPPPPIPTSPPQQHPTGFDDDHTTIPPPPTTLAHLLSKVLDLQSQLCAFQSEVRVSLTSLADQLSQMESRLGAKLDTVEVQTKYIDEETAT